MTLFKLLTFLIIGLALLWETRPAYGLAYLALVLFFLLQAGQQRAAKELLIERRKGDHSLFPGDQGEVRLRVKNPTSLPFAWVSVLDRIPSNLVTGQQLQRSVFSLSPRAVQEVTFSLTARDRGIYRLGPLHIFVGDCFGIRTSRFEVLEGETVVVYPEIYSLPELDLPSQLSFGNLKALQRINPDPTRLAGVRPYQGGDPLRTIHWPATARTHSLQVKQLEHTLTATCVLFMDFYQASYPVSTFFVETELAVSTAASLAAHFIRQGEACGLVANAVLAEYLPDRTGIRSGRGIIQIPARQGVAQLTEILTILAGVKPQEQTDFDTLVYEAIQQVEGTAILLWIVPQDTPEIVAAAWKLIKQGRQVQIFVVGDAIHSSTQDLQIFSIPSLGRSKL